MPMTRLLNVSAAMLLLAAPAMAERADAICSVEQVVACPAFEPCQRSLPGAVNMPALVKLDHSNGVIISRMAAGDKRTSEIGGGEDLEDGYALFGVDNGAPWSLRVNAETGRFSFASPQAEEGFIGFGVCSSQILQ